MSINHQQQQQQIRTPHRKMDQQQPRQQNPCNTFTPCTRLSRMTIESCSNGGQQGRIRTAHFQQLPVSNFNDKLMQVVREEQQQASQEEQSTHPNLNMFLGADSRISFFKEKDIFNSFATDDELEEEEEESDEGGDLFFSSNLCPMSSPERSTLTRQSIFEDDDEPVPISVNKRAIFDDEDEEEEEEEEAEEQDEDMEQDVYDPSTAWLSQIYFDGITDDNNAVQATTTTTTPPTTTEEQAEQEQEEENRAPRYWHNRQKEMNEKTLKLKRTILPQEEDNNLLSTNTRLPLREIRFEQELTSDDEGSLPTTKKKMILGQGGKSHKMRFMRSLSPPRFTTKRKGVSSSSSSGSSSSGSSLL